MLFADRRQRHLRAWAPVLIAALALAGCTTTFDPSTRPRRDASIDGTLEDAQDAADANVFVDGRPVDVVDATGAPDASDATVSDADDGSFDAPLMDGDDTATSDAPDTVVIDSGCGACATGESCCDGVCTDTANDPANCRTCGHACPGTACVGGSCSASCLLGFADCDHNQVNGCEQDLATSAANCGSCGVACPSGRPCVGGACACPSGTADCDGNPSNGCEVNIDSDPSSCGACGTACRPNQACVAGVCACAPGFGDCDGDSANGCEVDVTTSSSHCGSCRTPCGLNATCVAGVCECGAGQQRCPATAADCTTSTTDPNNCGTCGVSCGAGLVCTSTGCGNGCGVGETLCGTSCVDVNADLGNCGDCGNACAAGPNSVAVCRAGVCAYACTPGFADCDGQGTNGCEIDVGSSDANCGGCGIACTTGHVCISGTCQCTGGLRDCNGTCAACCNDAQCPALDNCRANRCIGGTCQASSSCALNCCPGSVCRVCCADAQCASAGANRGCGPDGTCSVCLAGYGDCDGDPATGCETVLATSVNNCGTCGNACRFPNATASCASGACVRGACNPGYADCDGNPANGCEVNLNADPTHCGSCTNVCSIPGGTNVCAMGTCAITSCAAGLGNCDTSNPDCETNVYTSVANCGACQNACSFANATPACADGVCSISSCNAGSGNCDGMTSNGCETDLTTSVTNCGTCGHACNLPNASATCTAGACAVGACNAGFGDCDGIASNGCETDLRVTVAHCGTCATACTAGSNASATCTAGSCGFTCASGYGDCDANAATGCETDLVNSTTHCGSCSTVCNYAHAAPLCSGGSCSMGGCETGYSNCDGTSANGCEVNTASSTTNCGRCGNACIVANGSPVCSAGVCSVLSCNPGFLDCDATAANGCELECGAGRGCGSTSSTCASGWQMISATNAPSARAFPFYALANNRHELFVWGGVSTNGAYLADGARYNWDTDTWTTLPAPPGGFVGRAYGRGVWTGSEFVVWGGRNSNGVLNTGARYQPGIGWRTMSGGGNSPAARDAFHAGLTADGTHVLIQGGLDSSGPRSDGALYDLVNDSWSAIASTTMNTHDEATFVAGRYLAVFGGTTGASCTAFGASASAKVLDLQNGATGAWASAPSSPTTPAARWFAPPSACSDEVMRGPIDNAGDVFIWGGMVNAVQTTNTGALWHIGDLTFRTINAAAPGAMASGAYLPVAVSTGPGFIGWSPVTGSAAPAPNNLVWSYDPVLDRFNSLSTSGGPPPIIDGAAFGWTGTEMLVWGGKTGTNASTAIAQGGRYAP